MRLRQSSCAGPRADRAETAPRRGRSSARTSATADAEPPLLAPQLAHALREDALAVHYQPIVTADHALLAAEALVRWPHPTRGLLGADTVLACAAEAGLEVELDQWVLHTAARQAADWPATSLGAVPVSVNLSALTPGHPELATAVGSALAAAGLPSGRLVLELVEHGPPALLPGARQQMQDLARGGVRWALDDFGSGHSNLARLKGLPFDVVKLDRSLTTDLAGPRDTAVLHAATSAAGALDCAVVAEGIETRSQLDQLQALGIRGYQGWLFAPALPDHELRDRFPA